jgi:hypothetical protein
MAGGELHSRYARNRRRVGAMHPPLHTGADCQAMRSVLKIGRYIIECSSRARRASR